MDIDNEFYFLIDKLTKRWYEIAPFSIIDVDLDISHRSITFNVRWFAKGNMCGVKRHVPIFYEPKTDFITHAFEYLAEEYYKSLL